MIDLSSLVKPAARSFVVAPRLPDPPKERFGRNPFDWASDITVDCNAPGCGWHAMGPRALMRKAVADHRAMYHSQDTNVILLNQPRQ